MHSSRRKACSKHVPMVKVRSTCNAKRTACCGTHKPMGNEDLDPFQRTQTETCLKLCPTDVPRDSPRSLNLQNPHTRSGHRRCCPPSQIASPPFACALQCRAARRERGGQPQSRFQHRTAVRRPQLGQQQSRGATIDPASSLLRTGFRGGWVNSLERCRRIRQCQQARRPNLNLFKSVHLSCHC